MIAVIFAPGSGRSGAFRDIGRAVSRFLSGHEVLACGGALGGEWLPGASLCGLEEQASYVATLREAVRSLVRPGPELIVCVGGDGLASYVADALRAEGQAGLPILGVAGGTMNVGPIVTVAAEDLDGLDPSGLVTSPLGAVEVLLEGRHLAYGFNDAVVATTFLGTVSGLVESLSAAAMAGQGLSLPAQPDPAICTEAFRVVKNGRPLSRSLPRPAQIVASPLGAKEFFGRAVAGVLCEAPYSAGLAALALLETVLVRPESPADGWEDFSRVDHLLFGEGDVIGLQGLAPAAQVVVDGNPFLSGGRDLELRYVPAVVELARPGPRAAGGQDVRQVL